MRNATTREDLPIMLADVLEGTICSRLLGRFLPIAAWDAEGSIPGTAPADGRWWIRGCEAHRLNNLLTLALSGTGWNWVDQEGHGYRVRQYVLFRASATLLGLWDVHYDPRLRVVSLWFSPSLVSADGAAVGPITATAETFGAGAYNVLHYGTLGLVGPDPDDEARETANTQLPGLFQRKLQRGFTVTYNLPMQQLDAVLARLPDGVEPVRPILDGRPWLANERVHLHASFGGGHILGPFDPAYGAWIDFRVEAGSGLRYAVECVQSAAQRMSAIELGQLPPLVAASSAQAGQVNAPATTGRVSMPACSWYLVTTPSDVDSTVAVRVRATPTTVLTSSP